MIVFIFLLSSKFFIASLVQVWEWTKWCRGGSEHWALTEGWEIRPWISLYIVWMDDFAFKAFDFWWAPRQKMTKGDFGALGINFYWSVCNSKSWHFGSWRFRSWADPCVWSSSGIVNKTKQISPFLHGTLQNCRIAEGRNSKKQRHSTASHYGKWQRIPIGLWGRRRD